MISLVLTELTEALELNKIASNCFGLAVPNEQRKFILPEGRPVTDKDWANGLAFYSRNGSISVGDWFGNRARTVYKTLTVPMQLVTVVKNERQEAIEVFLLSHFSRIRNYQAARFGINASSVQVQLNSIDTDMEAVWATVAGTKRPIDYLAIRANFSIILIGAPTCFAEFLCDGVGNRMEVITTEDGTPIVTENNELITP
jgi:hypothetical protein